MAELERVAHFYGAGLEVPLEVLKQNERTGHAPVDAYYLRAYEDSDGVNVPVASLSLEAQDKGLVDSLSQTPAWEWHQERNEWYPDAILHLEQVGGRVVTLKQAAMLTFAALNAAPEAWAQVGVIRRGMLTTEDEPFEDLRGLEARVMHKRKDINLETEDGYVGTVPDILGFAIAALKDSTIYAARMLPEKRD